jgi:hypothetical protein
MSVEVRRESFIVHAYSSRTGMASSSRILTQHEFQLDDLIFSLEEARRYLKGEAL